MQAGNTDKRKGFADNRHPKAVTLIKLCKPPIMGNTIAAVAHDTAEQIGQPAAFADRLAYFVVYLGLFDFQYLCLINPRYECHIRRPVPFLPCCIVGFDFFLSWIVLADFLCRQIHAVFIKDLQMLFGVGNVAVDKVCINLFYLLKKRLALETVVLYRKQMAFVNLLVRARLPVSPKNTLRVAILISGSASSVLSLKIRWMR